MAKANRQDFLAYLDKQVGMPYVWGAQGTRLTAANYEAEIRKRETSTKMANVAIAFTKRLMDAKISPIRAFDCSGLIMYYVQNISKLSGDLSAKWIHKSCKQKTRPSLVAGDLVFRVSGGNAYHVGAVVRVDGDDIQIIESMGRGEGVVQRHINASGKSYWNAYGSWDGVFAPYVPSDKPDIPVTQEPRYHKVKSGDTLIKIGKMYGVSYKTIMELNSLKSTLILTGQKLIVGFKYVSDDAGGEVAQYYTVKKGDSLWKIKNMYGITLGALCELNGIKSTKIIHPGERLRVA